MSGFTFKIVTNSTFFQGWTFQVAHQGRNQEPPGLKGPENSLVVLINGCLPNALFYLFPMTSKPTSLERILIC